MSALSYNGGHGCRPTIGAARATTPPYRGARNDAVKTFIVEDNPLILANLVSTLQELTPVKVVGSAADEAHALAWLEEPTHDCELLIVDIFLKAGSGLGVLRRIAQHGPGRRVVLTNYATPDIRKTCHELGADRVFDKSSELEELIAYCENLAQGRDGAPGAAGALE
jgi:DNA-binding NarL/FixJ family response regulator